VRVAGTGSSVCCQRKANCSPSWRPRPPTPYSGRMRGHPLGAEAQIIGNGTIENPGLVTMRTPLGHDPSRRHAGRRPTARASARKTMHEMGIAIRCSDAVRTEMKRLSQSYPCKIGVRIGEMAAIDPEALRFCFEAMIHETDLASRNWRSRSVRAAIAVQAADMSSCARVRFRCPHARVSRPSASAEMNWNWLTWR